jgi:SAM-dependent methyltransferase
VKSRVNAGATGAPDGAPRRALDAEIRQYWNLRIHDTELGDHPRRSAAFFAALDEYRLRKSSYLTRVIGFDACAGRDVLEIGCGAGLDLMRFARAGASVTGIDASRTAVKLARDYFVVAGQTATLMVADGAALPFADESFDLVYCHGVLSFARDPASIVKEAQRVLRPHGEAILMVYNSHSWMNFLAQGFGVRLGHADAPAFRMFTRREFERLVDVFPQVRIVGERLPALTQIEAGGRASIPRKLVNAGLCLMPERWLRACGWHLMAFCRKGK